MKRLGFIGLGLMGEPMAKNLVEANYEVTVYDINSEAVKRLEAVGAKGVSSPKAVAESTDVILTMLPNGPEVREVVLGKDGVVEGVREGQILIDMSSIAPLVSQEIARELSAKGVSTLDAPVSGGVEKAKSGTLAFMVGGEESTFSKCKQILEVMGGSVTLVGGTGAGQTTKLVNQMIVAVNIAAVAEALTFGKKAGVEPEKIFNAIRQGLAGSQCLEDKAPRMLSGDFEPGFRMNLHIKDLSNVFETSRDLHTAVPLTAQVMEMMQVLVADGHETIDHGGLALFYEKMNNVSLKKEV